MGPCTSSPQQVKCPEKVKCPKKSSAEEKEDAGTEVDKASVSAEDQLDLFFAQHEIKKGKPPPAQSFGEITGQKALPLAEAQRAIDAAGGDLEGATPLPHCVLCVDLHLIRDVTCCSLATMH